MKQENINRSAGFTLIEMILVAAIVGLFAAAIVAVINPRQQVLKANDSRRKTDLAAIQRGLESYYHDHGQYPASSSYRINSAGVIISWGTSWQPYMNVLPKDAVGSHNYVYYATADGQSYIIYASLERGASDPQACNVGNACSTLSTYGISTTACGTLCNYAVSSPDIIP